MLRELQIENVAVIEKATVNFSEGFNVLTGETGAGKSILIDSINAILGNRTNKEIVRSGAEKAVIFATFENISPTIRQNLEDQGYECEDELILSREVQAEGKSACRINGRPATATTVRDLCQNLVNIHGQLDNQELLDPERHIYILDNYAELHPLLTEYQSKFYQLVELQREINKLHMDETEKQEKIDLLTYQIQEIEAAQLKDTEEEELTKQKSLIKNSEKILRTLTEIAQVLSEDKEDGQLSVVSQLYEASNDIHHVEGFSDGIDSASKRLGDLYYEAREINTIISNELDRLDFDEGTLNAIEDRLDLIYRLKQKYGRSIPEILQFLAKAQKDVERIQTSEERLNQLKTAFNAAKNEVVSLAKKLSEGRKQAFERFVDEITHELTYLNMPNVQFVVQCNRLKELTPLGLDQVEFYISTNTGEPPKPLAKIASGGEMARIMLAIKSVLADKDAIPTLIFDEVDTGVSGTGAQRIGEKLSQTARSHQVICVTHSAQVASFADSHLKISKEVHDGRTFTTVEVLDWSQRVNELARIVSGEHVTELSLKNAEEMLSLSQGK